MYSDIHDREDKKWSCDDDGQRPMRQRANRKTERDNKLRQEGGRQVRVKHIVITIKDAQQWHFSLQVRSTSRSG